VEVHVLESDDVAKAICQAAERLSADIVCLASHGKSALANAVLGSIATSVLHQSRLPVLLNR
jgi:nucleotide-binding universal stress UspA family protein